MILNKNSLKPLNEKRGFEDMLDKGMSCCSEKKPFDKFIIHGGGGFHFHT